jgi:lysine-N-methylase
MNEVRFFCIQMVKLDGLQLWQKLAIVGLLCESLTEALKSGTQRRLPEILQNTQDLLSSGQTTAMFDGMEPHYGIQAVTFTLLWQAKSQYIRPQHQPVYEAMAQGLGADETGRVSEEQLVARYAQGVARLPQALHDAPALLKNYVLNEMLRECFPFAQSGGNPMEQYLRLVTRFGLVRFMLAVQCSEDRPLPTPAWLAHTVQVFARRFQHDKAFATQVDSSFKNSGWDQLDKVLRFLKA